MQSWTSEKQDKKQKMQCLGQNERGYQNLRSCFDGLWRSNISWAATQQYLSKSEQCYMLSLKRDSAWMPMLSEDHHVWYVASHGAATLFTNVLEEFLVFLKCRSKNRHYFWTSPLWECITDLITIHPLIFAMLCEVSVLWKKMQGSWNHEKASVWTMYLHYSVG